MNRDTKFVGSMLQMAEMQPFASPEADPAVGNFSV